MVEIPSLEVAKLAQLHEHALVQILTIEFLISRLEPSDANFSFLHW
jgi:hypothetical protein